MKSLLDDGLCFPDKKHTKMKWTDDMIKDGIMKLAKQFDPIRMPSNREVKEMTGSYALSVVPF
jgi:hypothetical protein